MDGRVTVESLALTGSGVATIIEDGHKRAVFIPYACPGDELLVRITRQHKKYYEAEIKEILSPSPQRVSPRCKHFMTCGGCDLLHMSYEVQLEHKRKALAFLFKDSYHGKIPIIAGEPDQYRRKMRFKAEGGVAGYRKARSHAVENIDECRLITPKMLEVIKVHRGSDGEFYVIDSNEDVSAWPAKQKRLTPLLSYTSLGKKMQFSPSSFIQSNLALNEQLVKTVVDLIKARQPKTVLELFSGIGNFTAHLPGEVTAVEGDEIASCCAKLNAPYVKHITQDAYMFLEQDNSTYDVILLDPPRAGLAQGTLGALAQKAKTLVYVSCNPAQLKQELKEVRDKSLNTLVLVDMFPHTAHMEAVAVLE